MKHKGTRYHIRELLKDFPDGLGIQQIKVEIAKRFAISDGQVAQVVCQMAKAGELIRLEQRTCGCCYYNHNPYKLKGVKDESHRLNESTREQNGGSLPSNR